MLWFFLRARTFLWLHFCHFCLHLVWWGIPLRKDWLNKHSMMVFWLIFHINITILFQLINSKLWFYCITIYPFLSLPSSSMISMFFNLHLRYISIPSIMKDKVCGYLSDVFHLPYQSTFKNSFEVNVKIAFTSVSICTSFFCLFSIHVLLSFLYSGCYHFFITKAVGSLLSHGTEIIDWILSGCFCWNP